MEYFYIDISCFLDKFTSLEIVSFLFLFTEDLYLSGGEGKKSAKKPRPPSFINYSIFRHQSRETGETCRGYADYSSWRTVKG